MADGNAKARAVEVKNQGNTAFSKGDFAQAIRLYSEAISLEPNDHAFYTNRSAAYSGLNQHEKALADAERAIELKSDWMKGHYRKGTSLLALGRVHDAIRALQRASQLSPQDKDVAAKLQEAQSEMRRLEKERRETGEDRPPRGYGIEKEEGNELYKTGRYEQAVGAYTRALKAAQSDEERVVVLSNRAAALSQMKHYDRVLADCNECLRLDPQMRLPSTLKAVVRRGLAYEDQEKWELALEDMRRVYILDPKTKQVADAVNRLTRAIAKKKEIDEREKRARGAK